MSLSNLHPAKGSRKDRLRVGRGFQVQKAIQAGSKQQEGSQRPPVGLVAAVQAGDWPRFRGPDQNGISKETGLNAKALEGGASFGHSLAGPGKNLAHYIDQLYLPGRKFEGTLLSTMAAVANCLLGVFAGGIIFALVIAAIRAVWRSLG